MNYEDIEMTEANAIDELEKLQGSDDVEVAHINADDILCEFLKQHGYYEIVQAFESIDKWYA